MRRISKLTLGLVTLILALAPATASAATTPLAQVGSIGGGAGQLAAPFGLTVDPAGNVYVADTNNSRISQFNAAGNFVRAFGSDVALPNGGTAFEVCDLGTGCQAGEQGPAAGQFTIPRDVAVDGAGRLYVANSVNNRIDVFDISSSSTVTFLQAFGSDVELPDGGTAFEVCEASCQAGEFGGAAGQLAAPAGLTHDGSGSLFVFSANSANNRVDVVDVSTAVPGFLRAFGSDVELPDGGTAFEVCETSCQAGELGGAAGQLASPSNGVLDSSGNLYVGDTDNARISVFSGASSASPTFLHAFGRDVAEPNGGAGFEVCPTDGACRAGDAGSAAGQFFGPTSATLAGGSLYVVESANNRISVVSGSSSTPAFVEAFGRDVMAPDGGSAFEICNLGSGCLAGDTGAGAGEFSFPIDVATDCRGAIWVADVSNNRVQRLGEPGTPQAPCPPPPTTTPPSSPLTPAATPPPAKKKKCKKKKKKGAGAAAKKCKKKK